MKESKRHTRLTAGFLRAPYFGIFFGIFPILFVWAQNQLQVTGGVVLPVFLLTLAGVLVVCGLCSLACRSVVKGSALASYLFLFFFAYGHLYNAVGGKTLLGIEVGYLKFTLAYGVFFLAGLILLLKIIKNAGTWVSVLNIVSAALVLFNLVSIARFQLALRNPADAKDVATTVKPGEDKNLPDIYYIILDAYSRADFLQEAYHYDNSLFIEWLKNEGFYVAECSNSNYDGTLSSVSSSLNYSYIENYNLEGAVPDEENAGISQQLGENRVRQELNAFGYQFVTTRGYSAFNDIRDSDIYLNVNQAKGLSDSLQRAQFARLYLSTTALRLVFEIYTANPSEHPNIPRFFELGKDFEYMDSSSFWYNQTRYVFDSLEEIPKMDGNYLVYAHINAPHGPQVFDRDGNFRYVPPSNLDPQYYIDTVIYLNKRIEALVTTLLEESEVPPIIVIQADHGSHIVPGGFDKHKILNAYYLPGSYFPLYPTITPVNTFRVILNEYFGKDLEMLPDRIFVKVLNDREVFPSQCDYP